MKPREYSEEMEMPTPCESCGRWQELDDMCGSGKWYKDIVICKECSDLEDEEVELDNQIEDEENTLQDAEWQITESRRLLEQYKKKQKELQERIEKYRYGTEE